MFLLEDVWLLSSGILLLFWYITLMLLFERNKDRKLLKEKVKWLEEDCCKKEIIIKHMRRRLGNG